VYIALPRSVDPVVAMLAVLRTGAAFLPVDRGCPDDRIDTMLAESNAELLLTSADDTRRVPPGIRSLNLKEVAASTAGLAPLIPIAAGAPAYVMFTSGSTGHRLPVAS
jgi:acyl-coenzyme A synthetase/AMP-(fatty) acid ligase